MTRVSRREGKGTKESDERGKGRFELVWEGVEFKVGAVERDTGGSFCDEFGVELSQLFGSCFY